MNMLDKIMDSFAKQMKTSGIIQPEDIPGIDLYMDQVTTFMDKALARFKRFEGDKVLTKTMINNYTKAKIFPPPIKKKYTRTHIMLLIMIYHLKSILSIRDIGILFHPVLAAKSLEEQERLIMDIYAGFVQLQEAIQINLQSVAESTLEDPAPAREILDLYDDEKIKRILLVLLLVIKAYAEKQLAERVLDQFF